MRAVMVNVAIVIAALILGGVAVELALRGFVTKYELAAEMPIERDSLRITSRPVGARRVAHHPDTGRRHQVVYNDRGMRQHRNFGEAELKSCTNIAFFGDSFVENVRLPAPYSFTEPLDFLLNRRGRCFNVLNFGQDGYATDQELIAYEYTDIKDELDYVFYVFCDNDLDGIYANQLFKLDAYGRLIRNPAMRTPWWIEVVSHWYVTYLIIDSYRTLFPKKNAWEGINARTLQEKYVDKEVHQRAGSQRAETIRKDWSGGSTNEDLARALVTLQTLIRDWKTQVESNGGHFAIVLLPRKQEHQLASLVDDGIAVVDLYQYFEDEIDHYDWSDWRFSSDDHWNEAGNMTAAQGLYRYLEEEMQMPILGDDEIRQALATYYASFDEGWSPGWTLSAPPDPAALQRIRNTYTALETP